MKVILSMAMTANGIIATEKDDTSFVSETEWKHFLQMAQKIGNMIIGRRTYEVMNKKGEFEGLERVTILVMSHEPRTESSYPNVHFSTKSPAELLKQLEARGFESVLVAGGGKVNAAFMKAGLVDEVYLSIEPVVMGKGIRLFFEEDFTHSLELVGVSKLSQNEIRLHYRVKKS